MGLLANPFDGAFPVAPAAIAPATSAAGFAASQLVEAVAEVGLVYPGDRQNLPALPELLRLRPGSPLEVAAVLVLPLPAAGLILHGQNDFLHNGWTVWPSNGKKVIFGTGKNRSQNVAFRRRPQGNRYPF